MTCDSARNRWGEYAAGTLPETERAALDVHAASCATCRREREAYVRLETSLRAHFARPAPSGSLADAIVGQIREARRPRILRWSIAAAAAMVILSIAAYWMAEPVGRPPEPVAAGLQSEAAVPALHASCRELVLPWSPTPSPDSRTAETVLPSVLPIPPRRMIVAGESPTSARVMFAAHRSAGPEGLSEGTVLVVVAVD